MAIKKLLFLIAFEIFWLNAAFGQKNNRELQIGDKLPDITIEDINGPPGRKIQLRELYKDGLLIIDFWATWCVPCIQEMRFLDALKTENPKTLNVLMVTSEKRQLVDKFFNKPNQLDPKLSPLYFTVKDTVLKQLFPHTTVPHNIWIDKTGTVKAITGVDMMGRNNILNFNDSLNVAAMRTKKDKMTFESSAEFHLADSTFSYRSIITPYVDGINGGDAADYANGKAIRFFQWNGSITHLYWNAFSRFNANIRYNLMEVHTNDSLKFFYPYDQYKKLLRFSKYADYTDWAKSNSYCYALTLPQRVAMETFSTYMLNDLDRQFSNLDVQIKKRKLACTVVTLRGGFKGNKKPVSTDTISVIKLLPGYKLSIQNSKIDEICDWMFRQFTEHSMPEPFVVEINNTRNIRFDAELDLQSELSPGQQLLTPEMFYRCLTRLGYNFKRKPREYPVLVIREK
jgi:thiol-disulfide isomerase/thioredoxin